MKLTKIVLSILLVLSVGSYAEEETVDVNFRDLSVKDFIEMVSKITQKNILIEAEPTGKINFVSTKPIKKSALFSLANSILGGKGLTIIDQGEYYKVVKGTDAAGEGLEVSSSIKGETMKTVMFPLRNTNAAVLRAKIKPLLDRSAKVISFKENNVLAITATPRVLESIAKVINAVEITGEKKSVVIKLKNASVRDVYANAQNMAKKIFPQTIESETVDIFKDDATNSIILVGQPKNNNRMIKYIKQLDIQGESTTQKMYVIRLKNSNVEEMEKIMSKLISQMNNVAMKTPAKGAEPPSKAMVVSDIERNALVLLATAEQMKNIRDTIKRIDIPKVQVYVKAKIVEVDSNMAQQVGFKYGFNGGAITSNGLYTLAGNMGASALQISPALLSFLNANTNNFEGFDTNGNPIYSNDPAFSFDAVDKVFALGATLDLLENNGAARILSEPSVLCTNNKEAEIYVGQTMSILTQAQQSTTGVSNVVNNYSREDIGLSLKVKPRLSSNNKVTLEVETVLEDIDPSSAQMADRPTTTKRTVKTNAIVNNGEMIILGGLIKRTGGKGVSKVPLLGDIPILGELFKNTSDIEQEQNVVIYLTPYIVRESGDLQKLKSMLAELEEVQGRYNTFFNEALEEKTGIPAEDAIVPASRRIQRKPKSNLSILEEA
ncbi:type II secretion system secretin GspD [Sulfurovum sp. XTW-4]|uniref:Type II secretion system secretin GspD n=1 Tax=Sulfurovum xiamenensis TaxID=3019066 RepID=A0ABT7QTU7_9BACT|nr:type II secretion system secretin GspD [Sulfurovum xiamenensis]MDM5264004.1 type II secretion system secretin GspD [Sulfurovum xiamenensis]